MVWLYLVLVLAPALAIAYLIWNYQRKTALRNAERADRLRALVGAGRLDGATELPETRPTPTPTSTPTAPAVQPSAPYALRERILTPPQTLLYYLLRTGLPEHVVFAQVPLASVLEPDARLMGFAREEQSRKLLEHVLDFVIADKSLRPLSAVMLHDGTVRATGLESAQPAVWLQAAGMKYVELDSAALPRKEAIRALVLSS